MSTHDEQQALDGVRRAVERAVTALEQGGVADEALATFSPPHRKWLLMRKARMVPIGRAWRLGVFLVTADGALLEAGSSTRAVPPGYPGHQSVSAENRRAHRAAAHDGPFVEGETVNFDATAVTFDPDVLARSSGRLFMRDGRALVRWARGSDDDAAADFADYLDGRVQLAVDPPAGA